MRNIDIATLTALVSAGVSIVFWYAGAEKRKYGMERDILHVKRNQEQFQRSFEEFTQEISDKLDELQREVIEIRAEQKFRGSKRDE